MERSPSLAVAVATHIAQLAVVSTAVSASLRLVVRQSVLDTLIYALCAGANSSSI